MTRLLALAALVVALFTACSRGSSNPTQGQKAPPPEPTPASLTMGQFQPITGTHTLFADVTEFRRGSGLGSESYGGDGTRNLPFLDKTTLQSHMLFETNQQLLLDVYQVGQPTKQQGPINADSQTAVKWLMLRVVRQDTDNDGQLDANDTCAVGFCDSDGNNYGDVLPRAQKILGTAVVTDDRVTLAYVLDGRAFASLIDIPSRTIVGTQEIAGYPVVPPTPAN